MSVHSRRARVRTRLTPTTTQRGRRRGVVLIVVLALLTLLPLLGLTFTLYADENGSSARIRRAQEEIQLAERALEDLSESPDDPGRRWAAVIQVDRALAASSEASEEVAETRTAVGQRLPGLLQATSSVARALKRLFGAPELDPRAAATGP
jgi:hypothetical protein